MGGYDYCHFGYLIVLIQKLQGLARILGPWPTVCFTLIVLSFAAFCSFEVRGLIEFVIKTVLAVFFILVRSFSFLPFLRVSAPPR
jgi:hypothetical protein